MLHPWRRYPSSRRDSAQVVLVMKFNLRFLCLSLLAPGLAHGANLLDAVNAARVFDSGIAAAPSLQLAGHEKHWQGVAGFLPRAQLDGNYTKQDQPTASY